MDKGNPLTECFHYQGVLRCVHLFLRIRVCTSLRICTCTHSLWSRLVQLVALGLGGSVQS